MTKLARQGYDQAVRNHLHREGRFATMGLDIVQLLSDLIAIPSVNPMGRPASGPEFFEHRVTDYLGSFFTKLGLPFERQTTAPLRDNIYARLDGAIPPERGGGLLLFEA